MGDLYLSQYAAGNCSALSCRAFRVLLRMALVVRDTDSEPGADDEGLYFGGWNGLTAVLGYSVWDSDDDMPPNVKRTVARAIAELRDAGFISVAPKRIQRDHKNRVYRLSIRPIDLGNWTADTPKPRGLSV